MFCLKRANMKTEDVNIAIYIRESKKGDVIQLAKKEGNRFKRISTSYLATEKNLNHFRFNATTEWERLNKVDSKITFKKVFEDSFEFITKDSGAKTARDITQKVTDFLLPTFGECLMSEIDAKMVERWQIDMKKAHGTNMTKRCKNLLNRIFNHAILEKIIESNPTLVTSKIKLTRDEKLVREIYYKEEISLILERSKGWIRVFIMTLAYVGLRTNEIVALKWEDIRWESSKLHICRTIADREIGKPKTGERLIDIPLRLLKTLQEHKLAQEESEWIFPKRGGEHYSGCNPINRRHIKPLLKELGIAYRTIYSFRHTYATYALISGVSVIYIAKQLGHSDPSTTLKFYTKFVEMMGVDLKHQLDELLVY